MSNHIWNWFVYFLLETARQPWHFLIVLLVLLFHIVPWFWFIWWMRLVFQVFCTTGLGHPLLWSFLSDNFLGDDNFIAFGRLGPKLTMGKSGKSSSVFIILTCIYWWYNARGVPLRKKGISSYADKILQGAWFGEWGCQSFWHKLKIIPVQTNCQYF